MSVVLSEHLPLLAAAPDGIQKLRGLILELAVRGKLVPQDFNDEPASELLTRISEGRANSPSKWKERTSSASALAGEVGRAWSLPATWVWARFDSVADTRLGKMLDKAKNRGELKRYLRNTNVQWWRFELDDVKELRLAPDEQDEFRLRNGDLLICEGGEPGRCAIWRSDGSEMYFQKALHRARPLGGVLPEYLQIVLRQDASAGRLDHYFTGATIKHFPGEKLAVYVIPLPPAAEQHRIVAKVDELMALCDRLEAEQTDAESAHAKLVDTLLGTLTQSNDATDLAANWQRLAENFDTLFTTESSLDALKQTILQLAVMGKLVPQDPNDEPANNSIQFVRGEAQQAIREGIIKKFGANSPLDVQESTNLPAGWSWSCLAEVVRPIPHSIKRGPFGSAIRKDMFVSSGIKIYEQQHAIYGDFSTGRYYINAKKFEELSAFELFPGDVLVSCSGTVGKVAIVPPNIERGIINQALLKLSLHQSALLNEYFLILFPAYFLKTNTLTDLQGTAQKNMPGMDVMRVMPFPLPPLAEQHRIVAKVDELMALCDRLKADLGESRRRQERLASTLIESALNTA